MADDLLAEQAIIAVYDPKVKKEQIYIDLNYLETRSEQQNSKGLVVFDDPYEACKDVHAIAILTEWEEFKTYNWQNIYDQMQKPAFIFDGRNVLNKKELEEIGFVYQAIGS